MSANADLITVETYVRQGKTIENLFFIYGPICKQIVYSWLFEASEGGGGIQLSDWAYLALQLSSHPYLCTNSNNFIDPYNCITLDFCQ